MAGGGRHFPHFLKLTWIYELPIGPGKAIDVDGVLGQIVGGWTIDRHPQLPHRRHAERLRQPHQRRPDSPSVPTSSTGVDPVIFDGSHRRSRERHAVPQPGGVCDAAAVGAGRPVAAGNGAAGPRRPRAGVLLRGHRADEALHGRRRPQLRVQSRHDQRAQSLGRRRPGHRPVESELRTASSASASGARRLQLSLRATF